MQNYFEEDRILGPNPAPLYKIKGVYRWQVLIKCFDNEIEGIKDIISRICIKEREKDQYQEMKYSIDINPFSIM